MARPFALRGSSQMTLAYRTYRSGNVTIITSHVILRFGGWVGTHGKQPHMCTARTCVASYTECFAQCNGDGYFYAYAYSSSDVLPMERLPGDLWTDVI